MLYNGYFDQIRFPSGVISPTTLTKIVWPKCSYDKARISQARIKARIVHWTLHLVLDTFLSQEILCVSIILGQWHFIYCHLRYTATHTVETPLLSHRCGQRLAVKRMRPPKEKNYICLDWQPIKFGLLKTQAIISLFQMTLKQKGLLQCLEPSYWKKFQWTPKQNL